MTVEIDSKALQYICRIRNLKKHNYAIDYLAYLRGHQPEPNRGTLSYMAAQAVRTQLHKLVK